MVTRINQNNSGIAFKLDDQMKKHNMSKNHLSRITGFRFETIQGYYNGSISRIDLYIISDFCKIFDCKLGDLIEFVPGDELEEHENIN